MKSSKPNNPSLLNTRKRVQITFNEPTLTKQSFKHECNINNIINKFSETGQIPNINQLEKQYGFAPNIDLKTSLDMVKNLNEEFENLDPKIQQEFDNNPRNYAAFLQEYNEAPERFSNASKSQPDTSVSKTDVDADKVAIKSTDGGS